MKNIIWPLIAMFVSSQSFAQTDFSAAIIESTQVLSISLSDDGIFVPFEAGAMWSAMKGLEQRKYIEEDGFSIECDALKNAQLEIFGSCIINIPMKNMQLIGDLQVFKVKGAKARKLNQYFIDSAYVRMQNGQMYLSSYNTRSEFYFGIKDQLIKR
jgi:hypothetical protein